MVWYSYTFKNCTQFAVIHTVRGFSVIDEAEVDFFFFFWNSLAFSMIHQMLAIDLWFLFPFQIHFEHLEVLGSYTVEAQV